jgi:hypothetical protein
MAHFGITSPKVMLSRNIRKPPNTLSIQRCSQDSFCGVRRIQVFGNLQVITAERLNLDPVLMAAANSAGGVS